MNITGALAVIEAKQFFNTLKISEDKNKEIEKIIKTILSNVKNHASYGKLSHKIIFDFTRLNKRIELANYIVFKLRDEFLHSDIIEKKDEIEFIIMVPV